MSDITNYAYIWYKKDPSNLLEFTSGELDKIFKIIIDYSYPCYLSNDSISDMSEADRKELLEHELLFIQKKLVEAGLVDVIIVQIPRVLYDLFNIYYKYRYNLQLKFSYNCDDSIINRKKYNEYTYNNFLLVKKNIFTLNNFIVYLLFDFKFNLSNLAKDYEKILIFIIEKINNLEKIITDTFIKILKKVLLIETQYSKEHMILYRGANYNKDSTIINIKKQQFVVKSLSFNQSILSSFIGDQNSCTLCYIAYCLTELGYSFNETNNKIKLIVKKYHINDLSNEFSFFFIPPIHPFLQLYSLGELNHPRTKISFELKDSDVIEGIACMNSFNLNCDYIISDKTILELETLYQQYKLTGQISVWQKKYLKYKNKYLEFKKYLLNKNYNY
jgi:hypothetical protein